MGWWALREACRQLAIWHERFPADAPLTMAVNLSGKQFVQSDLLGHIQSILMDTGVPASSL
jgi:EAL domain-containing protein (putative c-di-GMP-specific phosphodiesterase class I)